MATKIYTTILVGFLLMFGFSAKASHMVGLDVDYVCIPGTNNYLFTVSTYRDCSGVASPNTIVLSIQSASCGVAPFNVNMALQGCAPLDPNCSGSCNGGTSSNYCVEKCNFTAFVAFPLPCSDWCISTSICCRNTNSNLSGSGDFYWQTCINTALGGCNSPPRVSIQAVQEPCVGDTFVYQFRATDADNDSLTYEFTNPLAGAGNPIAYTPPYTTQNPINASFINLDPVTGEMKFVMNQTGVFAFAIMIREYERGTGVLKSETIRDIQFNVLTPSLCPIKPFIGCFENVQNAYEEDCDNFSVCPGANLTFDIKLWDTVPAPPLKIVTEIDSAFNPFPGMSYTLTGIPTDTARTMQFSWTPPDSFNGCDFFTITLTNNQSPKVGQQSKLFKICVLENVEITNTDTIIYCGVPLNLRTINTDSVLWRPGLGLSDTIKTSPTPATLTTTLNTLSGNETFYANGRCGIDSVFVLNNPAYSVDAYVDGTQKEDTICVNSQTTIHVELDPLYGPYITEWLPPLGLVDPLTGLPNNTDTFLIARPTTTTTYVVSATAATGCVRYDSIRIDTLNVAPAVSVSADKVTICPGETVNLFSNIRPGACGPNPSPCTGNSDVKQVTQSGASTGTSNPINYPCPIGHRSRSARHQVLYRATEMDAAGLSGGAITDIALSVNTLPANQTLTGFTVQMGCTSASSLSSPIGGLTTVFSGNLSVTAAGTFTIPLSTEYLWDGVSNLVVEFCFNSASAAPINPVLNVEFTSYNSVLYVAGNSNQCSNSGMSTSTSRPLTTFTICNPDLTASISSIDWLPNSGVNAVDSPSIQFPHATPQQTTTYSVEIRDASQCIGEDFLTVFVVEAPSMTIPNDTAVCLGLPTPIYYELSGGNTPPYTGTWSSIPNDWALVPGDSFQNVSPTVNTQYVIEVENSSGICTLYDTIQVDIKPGLTFVNPPFVQNNKCWGDSTGIIDIDVTNGAAPYVYDWTDIGVDTDVRDSLPAGTYTVDVTDDEGCVGSISGTITPPTPLVLDPLTGTDSILCNNDGTGSVTATVTGGSAPYSYSWSNSVSGVGVNNINGLDGGTYTVTVTDDSGCGPLVDSFTIYEPDAIVIDSVNVNHVSFAGAGDGEAFTFTSGGVTPYTYEWYSLVTNNVVSTNKNLTNSGPDTIRLTVTDKNGCDDITTVIIIQPEPLDATVTQTVFLSCNGDTNAQAVAVATGGVGPPFNYTYSWNSSPIQTGATATGLGAGNYTVQVSDGFTTVAKAITIMEPSGMDLTNISSNAASCNGFSDGTATINPSGGTPSYTYLWDANASGQTSSTANGLSAGSYTVTVTDNAGCTAQNTVSVTEPTVLTLSLVSSTNPSCFTSNDGSITVSAAGGAGGYTYNWSLSGSTTSTATGLGPSAHGVTVTDANGCTATIPAVTLTSPPQINITLVPSQSNCIESADGSIATTVSGGSPPYVNYFWSNGSTSQNPTSLAPGNYTVTVTDANGCTQSGSVSVTALYNLSASATNVSDVSCNGGSDGSFTINVNPSSTNPYVVTSSPIGVTNTSPSNLAAGNYTMTITDVNGCEATTSANINEPSEISFQTVLTEPSCFGDDDGRIQVVNVLGGSPNYTYSWSNGHTTNDNNNVSAGTYRVSVTDSRGCVATESIVLSQPSRVSAVITVKQMSCHDSNDGELTAEGRGGIEPFSFEWNNGALGNQLKYLGLTSPSETYSVTVSDANGCTATRSATLERPTELLLTATVEDASCASYDDGIVIARASGGGRFGDVPSRYVYYFNGKVVRDSVVTFDNVGAGVYSLMVTVGVCSTEILVTVEEPDPISIVIDPTHTKDERIIELGGSYTLPTQISPPQYDGSGVKDMYWSPSSGLSCIKCRTTVASPFNTTEYTFVVTYSDNLCVDSAKVKVYVERGDEFFIPNIFTPNNDGFNDEFFIQGKGLSDAVIKVWDRWGEKVWEANDLYEKWDGTYKGALLEPGNYVYYVEVVYLNGRRESKQGSITLIR